MVEWLGVGRGWGRGVVWASTTIGLHTVLIEVERGDTEHRGECLGAREGERARKPKAAETHCRRKQLRNLRLDKIMRRHLDPTQPTTCAFHLHHPAHPKPQHTHKPRDLALPQTQLDLPPALDF